MRSVLYRRWAPPQSPVRIEFLPDVLHEVRAEMRGSQDRGYLFGRRQGRDIRIEAAIRTPHADDPRVAGMQAVGIYVVRARGEVFLTDPDLEQAERVRDGIALVICGGRAGFFAREVNGSMQAVRSYEEFLVADAAPKAEASTRLAEPKMTRWWRHPALPPVSAFRWAFRAAVVLAGPAIALAYLQPRVESRPLELTLKDIHGQLVVAWDPVAMPVGGHLEISEGDLRTVVTLAANEGSVTYLPESGDVEVRVRAGERSGYVHWRSGRR